MGTSELAYFGLFIHYALGLLEIRFNTSELSSLPTLGLNHFSLFKLITYTVTIPFLLFS